MAIIDLTAGRFDGRKPVSGAGGQETIAPSGSSPLTKTAGARYVAITPRTQAISVTFGGVVPTASLGMHVGVGDVLLVGPGGLAGLRMIQEAASASVDVEYFS
jgi:hypothetical protein